MPPFWALARTGCTYMPYMLCTVKPRALTEKEWDPLNWDGDVREDPGEAGDIEPLNPDESCYHWKKSPHPSGSVLFTSIWRDYPAQPDETVMASPQAGALQDNADSPQDLPPPPLFASITRLKSQQAPKVRYNVWPMRNCVTLQKKLLEFSNLYRQKSEDHVWEWIRVGEW